MPYFLRGPPFAEAGKVKQPNDDQREARGRYLIPVLLHDAASMVSIKGVIVNLSATGCRVLTNDPRVRAIEPGVLKTKTFLLDFDFQDLPTAGVEGRVANLADGPDERFDRALGIAFARIDPVLRRDLNRAVRGDRTREGGQDRLAI